MLALYIAFSIDLPHPYWAMVTVYIVSHPFSGATRSKAMFRLIETLIGASATVLLPPNLVDAPVFLSLALAGWVGGCLFLALLDRTPRSYTLMLAGYTAAIVGFPAVMAPDQIFDTRLRESWKLVSALSARRSRIPSCWLLQYGKRATLTMRIWRRGTTAHRAKLAYIYAWRCRRPDTSAASCWCELSRTGCRKSPWAPSARSGSPSSAGLHRSSRNPERPRYGLAPS